MTELEREVRDLREELEDMKLLIAAMLSGDLEVVISRLDIDEEIKH